MWAARPLVCSGRLNYIVPMRPVEASHKLALNLLSLPVRKVALAARDGSLEVRFGSLVVAGGSAKERADVMPSIGRDAAVSPRRPGLH